jgi:hypothetical protein
MQLAAGGALVKMMYRAMELSKERERERERNTHKEDFFLPAYTNTSILQPTNTNTKDRWSMYLCIMMNII